jgi:hypothetical protein
MPSILYSTSVLLLLELEDDEGHTTWDDPVILDKLGIKS